MKGDDEKIFKLKINVHENVKRERAVNLKIDCSYKIRGSEEEMSFSDNLTMRLYSEDEFNTILNPFLAIADSGPVKDNKMFEMKRRRMFDNYWFAILSMFEPVLISLTERCEEYEKNAQEWLPLGNINTKEDIKKRLGETEAIKKWVNDVQELAKWTKGKKEITDEDIERFKKKTVELHPGVEKR